MYNEELYNENFRKIQKAIRRTALIYGTREETPLMMSILVTNRCQLRCRHCFNASFHDNTLALSQNLGNSLSINIGKSRLRWVLS